jgi:ABC-type antimicrobial peptide transport system permease subunit
VSQRTRELGVRLALGAAPRRLLAMVLWQGAALTSGGALVGIFGSWASSKLLANAFYGVGAFEPLLYAGPAVLLVVSAALASYVPALRASRVDPMEALRAE